MGEENSLRYLECIDVIADVTAEPVTRRIHRDALYVTAASGKSFHCSFGTNTLSLAEWNNFFITLA
jgi:hypothetical protein